MASSVLPAAFWPPFKLHNGNELPAIGPFTSDQEPKFQKALENVDLGTYRVKDRDTIFSMVDTALHAGYRSFDTAAVYGNEIHIGKALQEFLPKYDLVRDDVHITSKLSNAEHGSVNRVIKAFDRTEEHLGYTPDLYLIHYPGSARLEPRDIKNRVQRHNAWSAMASLYDSGRIPSIGVSNFTVDHLENLLKVFHSDIPVVNQVEWHPLHYDEALLKFCNENSIQLQGYHSLGGNSQSEWLLKNPVVKRVANDHSVSASQVLLTWALQKDVAVIPKSTNPQHIAENLELNFKMTPAELNSIDTCYNERVKFAWDPTNVM